jgi:magnesium-transporting ATPase (P-type)
MHEASDLEDRALRGPLFPRLSLSGRHERCRVGPDRTADLAAQARCRKANAHKAAMAIEIVYLFNSRSIDGSMLGPQAFKGNRIALWASAAILVLQLAFTYAPPLQMLFDTAALPAASWGPVLAAAAVTFLMVEGEKAVARAWARRRG